MEPEEALRAFVIKRIVAEEITGVNEGYWVSNQNATTGLRYLSASPGEKKASK